MPTLETSAVDETKGMKRMQSGRAKVVFMRPLYSPVVFKLSLKAAKWVETMATDGINLMFNVGFVLSLPINHLLFSILHECLHCLLRHPARRGTRDPRIWNIATDLLINAILVFDEGLEHPNWILLDKKYHKKPDGSRWTAEEIYDDLLQQGAQTVLKKFVVKCPCVQKDPSGNQGGSGQKSDKDEQGAGKQGAGQGAGKDKKDQKGQGAGKDDKHGSGKDKGADGGSGDSGQDQQDGDVESGTDPSFSDPNGWDIPWTPEIAEEWKQAAIQTEQQARMKGNAPGWLTSLVDDLVNPVVPIERVLAHVIGDKLSNETSWRNPSRRFVSRGLHLPTDVRDKKDGVIVIDTSGSIGDDEGREFLGAAFRVAKSKGINELRVIQCDMRIVDDVKVKNPEQLLLHIKKTGLKGRGGTSFREPFERLEKDSPWGVSFMLYFTDLCGDFPEKKPRFPLWWVTICKEGSYIDQAKKIGRVVFWDRKTKRLSMVN